MADVLRRVRGQGTRRNGESRAAKPAVRASQARDDLSQRLLPSADATGDEPSLSSSPVEQQGDDRGDSGEPVRGRQTKLAMRNRWAVAVTLARNPALQLFRKRVLLLARAREEQRVASRRANAKPGAALLLEGSDDLEADSKL
jgi:hypothetical protein